MSAEAGHGQVSEEFGCLVTRLPNVDLGSCDVRPRPVAVDRTAARLGDRGRSAAYCPYSNLQVGAAALVDDGRVITGCNVENASYGLGLCAECTLVGQLRLTGGGRLVALACRSGTGELLMPCGRCRQVIYEFGGPSCWWTPRPGRRR